MSPPFYYGVAATPPQNTLSSLINAAGQHFRRHAGMSLDWADWIIRLPSRRQADKHNAFDSLDEPFGKADSSSTPPGRQQCRQSRQPPPLTMPYAIGCQVDVTRREYATLPGCGRVIMAAYVSHKQITRRHADFPPPDPGFPPAIVVTAVRIVNGQRDAAWAGFAAATTARFATPGMVVATEDKNGKRRERHYQVNAAVTPTSSPYATGRVMSVGRSSPRHRRAATPKPARRLPLCAASGCCGAPAPNADSAGGRHALAPPPARALRAETYV